MKVFNPHNPALEKLLKSTHLYNVSETDILEADLPEDLGTTVTVADIMETDFITIGSDEDLSELRLKMKQYNVERVSVVEGGRLVRGNVKYSSRFHRLSDRRQLLGREF